MQPLMVLPLKILILAALVSFCPMKSTAETDSKAGLMWQDTGLPAVFPLIVKSNPGSDIYMTLHDPETKQNKLAAYIVGGNFFKVLVPPGTYDIRFAAGAEWQGEEALFGADTRRFNLHKALNFKVQGLSSKAGHLIDLTKSIAAPVVEARYFCQDYTLAHGPRPLPPFDDSQDFGTRLTDPSVLQRFPGSYFDPARLGGRDRPTIVTDFEPYFSTPKVRKRARLC